MIESQTAPAELTGDFDAFFSRLDNSGRTNVERHLAACKTDPTRHHERLWTRLVALLAGLTPHSIRTTGQRAVQFFVADGKYRLQLFALEDMRDGKLVLYAPDLIDAAVASDVLGPTPASRSADDYPVCEAPGEFLTVERLTAAATTSAPEYYKHLLDWNRKAVRITIPTTASGAQIRAVQSLCVLAARNAGK